MWYNKFIILNLFMDSVDDVGQEIKETKSREPFWIIIVSVGLALLVSLLVIISLMLFQKPEVSKIDIEKLQIQIDNLNERLSLTATENVKVEDKTNLSVCGNFPTHSGEDELTSEYFVCREIVSGDCYYKTNYLEPIPNCKVSGDTNPYGNPTCFKNVADVFDFSGVIQQRGVDASSKERDVCALTTKSYFDSKMK